MVKSSVDLRITKDGATVASEVELRSSSVTTGAILVKEVTSRTNEFASDGTTTATFYCKRSCLKVWKRPPPWLTRRFKA
ncbi:MAG: hypothetical protein ACTS7D_00715 [Candidatus Hodgkinia cicadicola]